MYGVIQGIYIRSSRQLQNLGSTASSALTDLLGETKDGMQHIRSFGWRTIFRHRFYAILDQSQKTNVQLHSLFRWLHLGTDVITGAAAIALFQALSSNEGHISTFTTGLALNCIFYNNVSASRHIKSFTSFILSLESMRHIHNFVTDTPQEQNAVAEPSLPDVWPSAGKLEFNALTAYYTSVVEKFRDCGFF